MPALSLVPSISNIGDTLGAHMSAALAFIESDDPVSIQSSVSEAMAIADAYAFPKPEYLAGGRFTAEAHPRYLADTFVPRMRERFDSGIMQILNQFVPAENIVENVNAQKLDTVFLPDMVRAGLVTFSVARNLSVAMKEAATILVESGIKTLERNSGWYVPKAWIPRALFYVTGPLSLYYALSNVDLIRSEGGGIGLSVLGAIVAVLVGELFIPIVRDETFKPKQVTANIAAGRKVLDGALAAFMSDFTDGKEGAGKNPKPAQGPGGGGVLEVG